MEKKKFNCKMQDIPIIAGFLLSSMERDKADFISFSPMYADPFMANLRDKQNECYEIVKSADVLKHQKMVKTQIDTSVAQLRVLLNKNEGYLKLAEKELDIKLDDFGIKAIRNAMTKSDLEKTISEGRSLVINLKRNATILNAKGLKQEGIDEVATAITELNTLNEKHNTLKNDRSRAASDNNAMLNETWDVINMITSAGRALYRGSDAIKLKEYTMSNLQKRVYNETSKSDIPAEPVQL